MTFDEMMTPAEVAKMLKISVKSVYRLAEDGELPSIHVGRLIRFTAGDVLEYLQLGSVGNPHILREDTTIGGGGRASSTSTTITPKPHA